MIANSVLQDSMIGNYAKILSYGKEISIGDYTTIE
jgi:glucose-1-phosphate thymidylyltransferase